MSKLLATIVDHSKRRTAARRAALSLDELRRRAKDVAPTRSLHAALSQGFCVIAEHKRRSPSGGAMNPNNLSRAFDVYATRSWIRALSVLTDEDYFDGSLDDLATARAKVAEKPILRKDFIVDEYQVWEAKVFGADAILLMTVLHMDDPPRLSALFDLASDLGLEALIELGMEEHDPEKLAAIVPSKARLCGVNSRRFREGSEGAVPFQGPRDPLTSLGRHREMRNLVPQHALAVAESGIYTAEDLEQTRDHGYHAALIGTAFVRGPASIESVAAELGRAFGPVA